MLVEIEIPSFFFHTKDEIDWLENTLLRDQLILHSNEIGDTICDEVKTLALKRIDK